MFPYAKSRFSLKRFLAAPVPPLVAFGWVRPDTAEECVIALAAGVPWTLILMFVRREFLKVLVLETLGGLGGGLAGGILGMRFAQAAARDASVLDAIQGVWIGGIVGWLVVALALRISRL